MLVPTKVFFLAMLLRKLWKASPMNQPTVQAELTQEQIDAIMDGDGITVTINRHDRVYQYTAVYDTDFHGYNYVIHSRRDGEANSSSGFDEFGMFVDRLTSIAPLGEWTIKESN